MMPVDKKISLHWVWVPVPVMEKCPLEITLAHTQLDSIPQQFSICGCIKSLYPWSSNSCLSTSQAGEADKTRGWLGRWIKTLPDLNRGLGRTNRVIIIRITTSSFANRISDPHLFHSLDRHFSCPNIGYLIWIDALLSAWKSGINIDISKKLTAIFCFAGMFLTPPVK